MQASMQLKAPRTTNLRAGARRAHTVPVRAVLSLERSGVMDLQPDIPDPVVSAPAPAGSSFVRVGLKLPFKAPPGQGLGVVGSAPVLGQWKPENALRMMPGATPDVWQIDFFVNSSDPVPLEYKYVLLDPQDQVVAWGKDPNRRLEVGTLQGSTITVSEQWDAGPREIRLVVGLADASAAAGRSSGNGAQGSHGVSAAAASATATGVVVDAEHAAAIKVVQGQLKHITAKLSQFEGLRRDVVRLVEAGPLAPSVSAKQLTELAQQLSAFEDVQAVVAEFAQAGPAVHLRLTADQLVDVSIKLAAYDELEDSLSLLVGQLEASRGGCPVSYSVGKSIALAAAERVPMHHRPYRW